MYNFYDVSEEQARYFLTHIFGMTGNVPIKPDNIEIFEDTDINGYVVVFMETGVGGVQYAFNYDNVLDVFPLSRENTQEAMTNQMLRRREGRIFEDDQGRLGIAKGVFILPENKFLEIAKRIHTAIY